MNLQKIRGRIIAGEQIHLQRKEFYENYTSTLSQHRGKYTKL